MVTKIVTNGDTGEGYAQMVTSPLFLKCSHLVHMRYSSHVAFPVCILTKVTRMISDVWRE